MSRIAARPLSRRRALLRPTPPIWQAAFDASDPLWANPGDGNAVSSWRDASGHGFHATQATGTKQPIYRAASAGMNGKPVVSFDGVDDFLQTVAWPFIGQPNEIIVIGRFRSLGASKNMHTGIASGNRHQFRINSGGTLWTMDAGTALSGGTADTSKHFFREVYDSTDTLDIDGVNILSGNAGALSLTGFTIGAAQDGTAAGAVDIAFIGISDSLLSARQRDDLLAQSRAFYATP